MTAATVIEGRSIAVSSEVFFRAFCSDLLIGRVACGRIGSLLVKVSREHLSYMLRLALLFMCIVESEDCDGAFLCAKQVT